MLDKNRAPMGPEILSNAGVGVCRKAPKAFPDPSSVLDKFQSAISWFLSNFFFWGGVSGGIRVSGWGAAFL